MKKWIIPLVLICGFVLISAGCASKTPAVAQCPTALPSAAIQVVAPTATIMPTIEPTPITPWQVIDTTVTVEIINFRSGPGTIFPIVNTYAKGAVFQVYAKDPGDGWVFVHTANDQFGWVVPIFLVQGLDLSMIPAIIPPNVFVVSGRVLDLNGKPAPYVQFAVTKGIGTSEQHTDGQSNKDGWFYAYLPANASGSWTVSFVAYGCGPNFQGNCDRNGSIKEQPVTITLPLSAPLQFTWTGN